ncbi:SMI1/KNR4 family protein [Prescottella agglutinans]|uniref:SMI1/KNR4 family protein n=1 Tax=Prescottella agglutinans TaxID=1644129 RepID=UPI003D965F0A
MEQTRKHGDRIAEILTGLDRLRAVDLRTTVVSLGDREVIGYSCRIHGAAVHRYELAAPADPDALAAFEHRLGVGLPVDYREWITRVGDGGAGPMLGLLPLAQEAEDAAIDYAADFPFTAEQPCPPAAEDAEFQWSENLGRIHRGVTVLANEGCGTYNLLILRGPAAGQVWWHSYEHAAALPILHPDTRRPLTFLGWYELWLARALDPALDQVESFAEFLDDGANRT